MTKKHAEEFVKVAQQAVAGLNKSSVMIGILDGRDDAARWEFTMQVGHCLLAGKPLLLVVPVGVVVPEKLAAAATAVEYFTPSDLDSLQDATTRALTKVGIEKVH